MSSIPEELPALSTPSRIETKAVACEAPDGELVRLFAVMAKASFTYQANNRRSVEACSAFKDALLARLQASGARFVLENRADGLYTATGKVPSEPVREWLHTTLQKALVGAIHLERWVSVQQLQKFLEQLRVNNVGKVRKDATFQALWPEPFNGLELHELRFFGGYYQADLGSASGAAALPGIRGDASDDLRGALQRLDLSDGQLQRILALEKRLADSQTSAEEGEYLSLPREVLAALPADVVDDPAARPIFVDRLLDRFEKLVQSPGTGEESAPRPLGNLVELFRKLPHSFFTSEIEPDAVPDARPRPSQQHRPEDRADELEDASRVVPLVAALPEKAIYLEPDPALLQAEMLRVCLHQLGTDSAPRVAAPAAARVKSILGQAGPGVQLVLEHYVRRAMLRNSELPPLAVVDRVLLRLDQHGLLPELRRVGGLTVERVTRFFPNAFVTFLKSLTAGSTDDADALVRALKGLQETALAAGAKQLLQQGEILNPALLRKLLEMGGRNALGLASHLLVARNPAVQQVIVDWLREIGSVQAEAAPLVYLEASSLPVSFLVELCEFERTGRPNPRLRGQASGLLYSFIESTPNDAQWVTRKARAITGLAAFPGPSSEALLKQQMSGQGLLGRLFVPELIREAIQAVRAQWREGKHV